ncbi:hypothetical protein B0H17DRAFT_1141047 [Mycena rosella]|uniref:Uncharacterized protein n=1 Tax=Mycena rosella TaxID=1033263 RepID=A0AAD7D0N4_MYCRO|nr:hypothetical protein B0H17DRAFT_1141047 [Mycena rosella]
MANSTPSQAAARPPTPRRLRILALRDSLQRQIYRQTKNFPRPYRATPHAPAHAVSKKPCAMGEAKTLKTLVDGPQWSVFSPLIHLVLSSHTIAQCIIRDHASSGRPCTKIQMITPKLLAWQLDVLSALWVRYDLTGKKWGKQEVPERLHAMLPGPALPLVPSAPRPRNTAAPAPATAAGSFNLTSRKRKRSISPLPPHVPVRVIDLEVIYLTSPERKKRKTPFIDLTL